MTKRVLIDRARHDGWSGEWTLAMLVRLRWIAVLAQALLIAAVQLMTSDGSLNAAPLWIVTALITAANLGLEVASRRLSWAHRLIGPSLVVDIVALTALLGLSGGPSNPFSVLYLVHVTLAALTLRGAWLWTIVALAVLGYGGLFWWHVPLPAELGGHGMMHHPTAPAPVDPHAAHLHHDMPPPTPSKPATSELAFSAHLQGMWLALTIVAVLIAGFVSRLNAALLRERHALATIARQLSLTTLAAGAAHELSTPLSSIKLSAAELRDRLHELESSPLLNELLEDAALIVDEVNRARHVLDRMALGAGELRGEGLSSFSLERLAGAVVGQLGVERERVELKGLHWSARVTWPLEATAQALTQLVRNALDASPAHPVTLEASLERGRVCLVVEDRGVGMSAEVLERVGEPFFTTKAAGRGMGLGVFLAYTLVEQLGGQLRIDSSPGQGTRAALELPQEIS